VSGILLPEPYIILWHCVFDEDWKYEAGLVIGMYAEVLHLGRKKSASVTAYN
jgi:hypothetical protein